MPVRSLICSTNNSDFVLEVSQEDIDPRNVGISIWDITDAFGDRSISAYIGIRPEDVPILCRELRRFAKLAKTANPPKEKENGTRY